MKREVGKREEGRGKREVGKREEGIGKREESATGLWGFEMPELNRPPGI